MRTKEEIIELINDWENKAGESFLDYFDYDIRPVFLSGYILGKGYIDWSNEIMSQVTGGNYVGLNNIFWDEDFPSSPFYDSEDVEDCGMYKNQDKVLEFIAEILSTSKVHAERFETFINK